MHPADIVAALRKAKSGVRRLAEEAEVNPATVSRVVNGHDTSHRLAKKISKKTGIAVSVLWPGKYEAKSPARRRKAQTIGRSNVTQFSVTVDG